MKAEPTLTNGYFHLQVSLWRLHLPVSSVSHSAAVSVIPGTGCPDLAGKSHMCHALLLCPVWLSVNIVDQKNVKYYIRENMSSLRQHNVMFYLKFPLSKTVARGL